MQDKFFEVAKKKQGVMVGIDGTDFVCSSEEKLLAKIKADPNAKASYNMVMWHMSRLPEGSTVMVEPPAVEADDFHDFHTLIRREAKERKLRIVSPHPDKSFDSRELAYYHWYTDRLSHAGKDAELDQEIMREAGHTLDISHLLKTNFLIKKARNPKFRPHLIVSTPRTILEAEPWLEEYKNRTPKDVLGKIREYASRPDDFTSTYPDEYERILTHRRRIVERSERKRNAPRPRK